MFRQNYKSSEPPEVDGRHFLHDRRSERRDEIWRSPLMSEAVLAQPSGGFLPKWRWLTSEHPLPWLLPASALMVVFGIYPLLYALWLSLHKRNPVTRLNILAPEYNWLKAFGDQRVWDAISTTFLYT